MFKALETVNKYNLLSKNDKIIVGVSGGPDSVCLLHFLNSIKGDYGLSIIVAHINHNLRGEKAVEDMEFVCKMAHDLNLPFFVHNAMVADYASLKHMSVELAGREIRYDFFNKLLKENNADKIAVAHNLNDQAETILMHIFRGSGMQGLTGMAYESGNIIRPLMETSRHEILDYIQKNGLKYRIDDTNNQDKFLRNKIRLRVIPYIEENFNSNIKTSLSKTAEILRGEFDFIENYVDEIFDSVCSKKGESLYLNIDRYMMLDISIKRRLLRRVIRLIKGNSINVEFKHLEYIMKFIKTSGTGDRIDITDNIEILRQYEYIVFYQNKNFFKEDFCFQLITPGIIKINGNIRIKSELCRKLTGDLKNPDFAFLDYDKIKGHIVVRSRKDGDVLIPYGMTGKKKLQDYFVDMKIPLRDRKSIPLVASGSEILWIAGYRINDKYKITKNTKNILKLELIKDS